MKAQQEKRTLHIACAIDDTFCYPTAVMLVSLFENNIKNNIKFHLFSTALQESSIELFESLTLSFNQQFRYYRISPEHLQHLPTSERFPLAVYFRLLIPEIIDIDTDKFLYLDADTIVTGDLKPLFEINFENKIFGAVNDISAIDQRLYLKHNIPEEFLYFNAGVLLILKKQWNEQKATRTVLDYLKNNTELCSYLDQDGLNGSLFSVRKTISPVWNQQIGMFFSDKELLKKVYPEDLNAALSKPAIIHFNGKEKPWHQICGHPFKKEFRDYANRINEFHYHETWTFKKQIKQFLFYDVVGWKTINRYYNNKTLKKTRFKQE